MREQLVALREIGVTLTLLSIHAIMVRIIQEKAPELFEQKRKDGFRFKCSESFIWKYLHKTLGWSERCATKAAQKVPANHEEILMEAFL